MTKSASDCLLASAKRTMMPANSRNIFTNLKSYGVHKGRLSTASGPEVDPNDVCCSLFTTDSVIVFAADVESDAMSFAFCKCMLEVR